MPQFPKIKVPKKKVPAKALKVPIGQSVPTKPRPKPVDVGQIEELRPEYGPHLPNIFDYQARNDAEFGTMLEQIYSPTMRDRMMKIIAPDTVGFQVHSSNTIWNNQGLGSIIADNPTGFTYTDIANLEHDTQMLKVFRNSGPRQVARLQQWAGDTPYTRRLLGDTNPETMNLPMVLYHGERLAARNDFLDHFMLLQFDNPREMGMHLGTWRTAREFNIWRGDDPDVDLVDEQLKKWERLREEFESVMGGDKENFRKALMDAYHLTYDQVTNRLPEAKVFAAALRQNLLENPQRRFDDNLDSTIGKGLIQGLSEMFLNIEKAQVTQSMNMYYPRLKRGLFLADWPQNWAPVPMINRLEELDQFGKYFDELQGYRVTGDKQDTEVYRAATEGIWSVLNREGYDHILYVNRVEPKGGGEISMIVKDPSLLKPVLSKFDNSTNALAAAPLSMSMLFPEDDTSSGSE